MPVPSSSSTAAWSETNGGATTTSTPSSSASALRRAPAQNARRLARPLEHLPVAGDQHPWPAPISFARLDGIGEQHAREAPCPRAARATAPPPVETQSISLGEAELLDGAHRVAAADDRVRLGGRDRLGDRLRALREARPLEDAHRAVPEDRPRLGDARGERARASPGRCRAPSQPSGTSSQATTSRLGVGARTRPRRRRPRAARTPASRSTSSAILPPMRIVSAVSPSDARTPILSATLAPPSTATNGRSGASSSEPSSSSSRRRSRPAYAGSRCATPSVEACARCAEPNASLTKRSPCAASSRANAGSFAVSRGSKRVFSSSRTRSSGEQLAEPRLDRRQRERGIGALRAAQVGQSTTLGGAALEEELERRQRRADARVVGDAAVLERHVEVDADEDALARDVGRRGRNAAACTDALRAAARDRPAGSCSPTRCRTSRRP